jgi:large subunit ribosomal protein L18
MDRLERKAIGEWRRKMRVRKNVHSAQDRPRLTVTRTNKHIYAQIIDDMAGKNKDLPESIKHGGNIKAAELIGMVVAQRAIMHGIKKVVFDRGSFRYHGRIKALADAARKAGLEF